MDSVREPECRAPALSTYWEPTRAEDRFQAEKREQVRTIVAEA